MLVGLELLLVKVADINLVKKNKVILMVSSIVWLVAYYIAIFSCVVLRSLLSVVGCYFTIYVI